MNPAERAGALGGRVVGEAVELEMFGQAYTVGPASEAMPTRVIFSGLTGAIKAARPSLLVPLGA